MLGWQGGKTERTWVLDDTVSWDTHLGAPYYSLRQLKVWWLKLLARQCTVKINVLLKVPFRFWGKSTSNLPNIRNMDGQICVVPVSTLPTLVTPDTTLYLPYSQMSWGVHRTHFNSEEPIFIYLLWGGETKTRKIYFLTEQCLLSGSENKEKTQTTRYNPCQNRRTKTLS